MPNPNSGNASTAKQTAPSSAHESAEQALVIKGAEEFEERHSALGRPEVNIQVAPLLPADQKTIAESLKFHADATVNRLQLQEGKTYQEYLQEIDPDSSDFVIFTGITAIEAIQSGALTPGSVEYRKALETIRASLRAMRRTWMGHPDQGGNARSAVKNNYRRMFGARGMEGVLRTPPPEFRRGVKAVRNLDEGLESVDLALRGYTGKEDLIKELGILRGWRPRLAEKIATGIDQRKALGYIRKWWVGDPDESMRDFKAKIFQRHLGRLKTPYDRMSRRERLNYDQRACRVWREILAKQAEIKASLSEVETQDVALWEVINNFNGEKARIRDRIIVEAQTEWQKERNVTGTEYNRAKELHAKAEEKLVSISVIELNQSLESFANEVFALQQSTKIASGSGLFYEIGQLSSSADGQTLVKISEGFERAVAAAGNKNITGDLIRKGLWNTGIRYKPNTRPVVIANQLRSVADAIERQVGQRILPAQEELRQKADNLTEQRAQIEAKVKEIQAHGGTVPGALNRLYTKVVAAHEALAEQVQHGLAAAQALQETHQSLHNTAKDLRSLKNITRTLSTRENVSLTVENTNRAKNSFIESQNRNLTVAQKATEANDVNTNTSRRDARKRRVESAEKVIKDLNDQTELRGVTHEEITDEVTTFAQREEARKNKLEYLDEEKPILIAKKIRDKLKAAGLLDEAGFMERAIDAAIAEMAQSPTQSRQARTHTKFNWWSWLLNILLMEFNFKPHR